MKIFVELTRFMADASRAALRDRITALEDAGATGITMWDHLFVSENQPRAQSPSRPGDPLTTLAAVAALSDRLEVQTVVMNTQWAHPALLLRQFAQLAVLIGGERVTAGLGAGWNTEEFDALGMAMAPYRERIDRLEETLKMARQLFHEGVANLAGTYISARDLPLSPIPATAPRLLIGGGSDRILDMAGRYADVLDLHADPRHGKIAGRTVVDKHAADSRRRAMTTVGDLESRMHLVRAASRASGRRENAVSTSAHINYVAYGDKGNVHRAEEWLCEHWGHIPTQSLADNPYFLLGEPRQIADALIERSARLGLDRIILKEAMDLPNAPADPVRFCREVLPML